MRDESGSIVIKPEMVRKRYMEHLLEMYGINEMVEGGIAEGLRKNITQMERGIGQMERQVDRRIVGG